ncbi:alpha-taxilin [Anopheles ziemanni]|nr:alpha-taxilin isoform X2 [Anopheles coustani]XP_058121702.1 alpha-taxilin isoform X2 [Anopheles coustani]XP_058121704.1 alpha-taxilin isoform X2 [Anopheles coustani]XP_058177056.1 alpha-taxilin [Anopheles ziemanni]
MEVSNASNGEPRNSAEAKKLLREEKQREAKIVEQLTKALTGMSLEEKYASVYKRLMESEKENRRLVALHKQYERTMEATKREKENLILEHDKMAMTKTKLEALCRELQRQNKTIKDESLAQIQEEEDKRKQTQEKFQQSLNEIQLVMNENNEKNLKLKEDNMEMAQKFKHILEQYELRDQQMDKMNKQMELVTQLTDAKLAKMKMEANSEKELILSEKLLLATELQKVKKQLADVQMDESHLRGQVNMYTNKYSEFQDSLKKSRSIYEGYQEDMKKMSKKMKTLDKETMAWKSRWETSNATVQKLLDEQIEREKLLTKTSRQLSQLQKLCRTLQAERATYLAALKDANLPVPAEDPTAVDEQPLKDDNPQVPAKELNNKAAAGKDVTKQQDTTSTDNHVNGHTTTGTSPTVPVVVEQPVVQTSVPEVAS